MEDAALRNSWGWRIPTYKAFDTSRAFVASDDDEEDDSAILPITSSTINPNLPSRRLSLPNMGALLQSDYMNQKMHAQSLARKVLIIKEQVSAVQDEVLDLRQEASDLQEYSNAKIDRLTRYLGVLAEKASKLDQVGLDNEARLAPLRNERKRLFNDLLCLKGDIRMFCRVRPQYEHEGPIVMEFQDDFLIRVNTRVWGLNDASTIIKEFEFDRVYGPHVGQGELFQDVQPFVQSALDGYNVSIFAYGQTGSGKTYTMEGLSNDSGIISRAFEELFDLSNADSTPVSGFSFYVTLFELYNEQVKDLLLNSSQNYGTAQMGCGSEGIELVRERVENPTDFTRVYKTGVQNRVAGFTKAAYNNRTHLVLTIHIHYANNLSGETQYSKLSLVDMVGSERLSIDEVSGDQLTDLLHIDKSLSVLGDVFSALTAKKDFVPYGISKLTQLLADSLGGESKALIIVNISPCQADVQETMASLHFAERARNFELSLGNRDTIKKWRDLANEARKEVSDKEKEVSELQQDIISLKESLKDADDQCLLLFSEVQKSWKVAFTLQADYKLQTAEFAEKQKIERDQNAQLKSQVAQLCKLNQDQKAQLQECNASIQELQGKVLELEGKLAESQALVKEKGRHTIANPRQIAADDPEASEDCVNALVMARKLEEELSKRDELIERLHKENEKLFERLTERNSSRGSPKVPKMESKGVANFQQDGSIRVIAAKVPPPSEARSLSSNGFSSASGPLAIPGTVALLKSNSEKIKTTPAGEYLTAALNDFNPNQYEGSAAADGANKLLMLVLAAVIKAGAAREHEMLAEIHGAVFTFLRKMEPRRVMDTTLVSRVRILYIRSLLSRASELQSLKVPAVERFLEKSSSGGMGRKSSSRGPSPAKSPIQHNFNLRKEIIDEHIQGFKVNIKQERKSKFSSIVLKLRGIDQETWRQHVRGGKLIETTEEARNFAIGNKALAALFVHTPAGELQRQIRVWLAETYDFLSLAGVNCVNGTTGQLELVSTAIMDGWMAGLGVPQDPSTDAFGQLLSDYTKRLYTSQLLHLKDIAASLATEEVEDMAQIAKLRSALQSVEHKRRKVLQQMRLDVALLTKEEGGSPIRNPSTASEDARIASLMSLGDIIKQAEEIKREAPEKAIFVSKKKEMLSALEALLERMPALLSIDHPCARKHILEAKTVVESVVEKKGGSHLMWAKLSGNEALRRLPSASGDTGETAILGADTDVMQWSVLQFNNGSATPIVVKCGATPSLELVVKAQARLLDKSGTEMVSVVPVPSTLAGLSSEEIHDVFSQLPEAIGQLALARTADGTRARYARLYKALAIRVPALKNCILDLDRENSRECSNFSMYSKKSVQ